MLCKNCGAQIADNSVFCTNCGFRVRPVSEAVQQNVAVTAEQMPIQTEQAAQESAAAENTAQAEAEQESAAAENTAQAEAEQESAATENTAQAEAEQESAATGNTLQAEAAQESAATENTVQAESTPESVETENGTQAENAAQEGAVDGQDQPSGEPNGQAQTDSMSGEQPQTNSVPNGQMPYGQPQMNDMPNGQMPYGQPQMNGVPNGQMPYGQPPYGQPQMNGVLNGQMAYGQPQMNGMPNGQMAYGQPQMNGMPNGQMAYGQPQMNGVPNGQVPYGQPQAGSIPNGVPYGQAMKSPKKPFVMPAAVNVVGGLLAIAAVAVFVCALLFGKPEEKKSDLVVSTLAIPAQQQAVGGSDYLDIDLSNVTYQLEIPETDGYRAAQELAEGYIFADSDTRYLRESDLYTYSHSDLWHAYYEILAREGVDLSEIDDEEHEYFQRKSWYDPTISLFDVLMGMDEDQVARYSEMLENEEDPSYAILFDAGILNETEVFNMKLIEEYVTYGLTTMDEPEDALEDMSDE